MKEFVKELVLSGLEKEDIIEKTFNQYPDASQKEVKDCIKAQLKTAAVMEEEEAEAEAEAQEKKIQAMVKKEIEAMKPVQEKAEVIGKAYVDSDESVKSQVNRFFKAKCLGDITTAKNIQKEWAKKSLTVGGANTGAELVPVQFNDDVFQPVEEENVLFARSSKVQMTNNSLEQPTHGNTRGQLSAEAVTITETTPATDTLTLPLKKYSYLVGVSSELLADAAYDVASLVQNSITTGLNLDLHQFLTVGQLDSLNAVVANGVQGIDNILPSAQKTEQAVTSAAGSTTIDDLLNLSAKVKSVYRKNSVYVMPYTFFVQNVMKLRDGDGRPFVTQDLSGNPLIYGLPVLFNDEIPTDLTVGGVSDTTKVFFGDPSKILIGQKAGGLQFSVSDEANFAKDETLIKAIMRMDMTILDNNAWAVMEKAK